MTNGEKFKEVFGFGADGSRVIAVNATWWDCDFQNRKPKTNADLIRAMSDKELAELLTAYKCVDCILFSRDCKVEEVMAGSKTCEERILDWLREKVEKRKSSSMPKEWWLGLQKKEVEENECDCKEIFENTTDCPCDNCEKMKE